jgi:hypothetical protein
VAISKQEPKLKAERLDCLFLRIMDLA